MRHKDTACVGKIQMKTPFADRANPTSPAYLRGPRLNADGLDRLPYGRGRVLGKTGVSVAAAGTVPRQVFFVRRGAHNPAKTLARSGAGVDFSEKRLRMVDTLASVSAR